MIFFGVFFCCLDLVFIIVVSFSFKDLFVILLGKEKIVDVRRKELVKDIRSDYLIVVNVFEGWEEVR